MTRKPENDQVSGLSMDGKTMSDKPKKTSISLRDVEVNMDYSRCYIEFNGEEKQYTLVHNNPDYHVIKKSDVDGDELKRAIELTEANISTAELIAESGIESGLSREMGFNTAKCHKTILAALIVQSDPDMVRIPRKILEGMLVTREPQTVNQKQEFDIHNQAINDVLNYKPTPVGEERSDGEGE